MRTAKILSSTLIGTSAMTLFSYLISEADNRNYREPRILGQLVKRLPGETSEKSSEIAGWSAHYGVGLLFVALYHELWKRGKIKPSVVSGAIIGAASGLVGVAGWETVFKIHPNPPAKNLKRYFGHLILAHIVFGIFSAVTYKKVDAKKNKQRHEH